MLVLLERDNFCLDLVFSLSIYAVVCSNVVVHNSDHNAVMVAIVDYYNEGLQDNCPLFRNYLIFNTCAIYNMR